MNKLAELKSFLKKGKVYRRADLLDWSKSVDRHLDELVTEGTLQKLSQGLYYCPKETVFGIAPPSEEQLVKTFLKDDRFLLTSPNAYNTLGVGTTQLYNKRIVYNHKRSGVHKLGKREFEFRIKPRFPSQLTEEFLLVDLVNNMNKVAEDKQVLLQNVLSKAAGMDKRKLKKSVADYGGAKARKLFAPLVH